MPADVAVRAGGAADDHQPGRVRVARAAGPLAPHHHAAGRHHRASGQYTRSAVECHVTE